MSNTDLRVVRVVKSSLFGVKVLRGRGTSTCVLAEFYGEQAEQNAEAFKLVRDTMDVAQANQEADPLSAVEWDVGEWIR